MPLLQLWARPHAVLVSPQSAAASLQLRELPAADEAAESQSGLSWELCSYEGQPIGPYKSGSLIVAFLQAGVWAASRLIPTCCSRSVMVQHARRTCSCAGSTAKPELGLLAHSG